MLENFTQFFGKTWMFLKTFVNTIAEEELGDQVHLEEEEECRSSATPTQDDNASPVNGEPVPQPHPRLTEVCSLAEPSGISQNIEDIPIPVCDETQDVVVEDVSDGDLNEEDGGGENDLENMVLHQR